MLPMYLDDSATYVPDRSRFMARLRSEITNERWYVPPSHGRLRLALLSVDNLVKVPFAGQAFKRV